MNDVLSQEDIDALLSQVTSSSEVGDLGGGIDLNLGSLDLGGGAPGGGIEGRGRKKVKMYDFKRPDKFSKDQIRTLQMIHETFARLTTTSLSAQLRLLVHVHVAAVEQMTYEEFIRSIPNPSTLAMINMEPLKGSAIYEMDPAVTFTIIDRLFGGAGKYDSKMKNRELTDIESTVIETVIVRILNNLREAWANVIDLRPRLGNIETNPQFAQIVPPNDMVVLITLETKIGEVEGMTNFCIPYLTIEPIVSKLSAQYWYSSVRKGITKENFNIIKDNLKDVELKVTAELGKTEITLEEAMSLEEGDIIRLTGYKVNSDAILLIGKKPKFKCKPGIYGKRLAVQVTEELEELSLLSMDELFKGEEE
ncbi:MAG TPA: flagellar motor switch protein FliM [Spirochaetota bacterium]|nr:flagellar motor switch protein FliM [Spirochaetota bacterium]